jgi:hypothetical protein
MVKAMWLPGMGVVRMWSVAWARVNVWEEEAAVHPGTGL